MVGNMGKLKKMWDKLGIFSGPDLETEEGRVDYLAKELYRQMKGYTPREWSTGTKVLAGSLIAALGAGAGCATTRLYDRVETLPDEVDVLNIDSRPQGAEVIYGGKAIGKTPVEVTVRFNLKKKTEFEGSKRGGRIIEENIRDAWTWAKPETHDFKLYSPGHSVEYIEHRSDGKSNGGNYFIILRENGNKPLIIKIN
jgi:hypothetical protein